jgi:hypothetical protein
MTPAPDRRRSRVPVRNGKETGILPGRLAAPSPRRRPAAASAEPVARVPIPERREEALTPLLEGFKTS